LATIYEISGITNVTKEIAFNDDDKSVVKFNDAGVSKPILKIIDKYVENTIELNRENRQYLSVNL